MTQLIPAGSSGALDDINVTQGELRAQLAALVDLMRQVAGDAAVVRGDTGPMDPLSAPFTLYVNPYIGSDKFVGGSYNDYEDPDATDEEQIANKLKRLELQRVTCGYTPQRPFKTINRAVIEAAIITSKSWYTYTDPRAHVDCVSIVLSPGVHTVYNDPGSALGNVASWGTEKTPSVAELIAFNPTEGGVLLPRGCSLCGPDLRKTTIRPSWVPPSADEASDYSNRSAILRITGTGYFFGFTAMDCIAQARSHHLLDVFQFGSKAQLDLFYDKCFAAVGSGANLSEALTSTRGTEYEIVGPIDTTQAPTSSWDTTASASPYIFNCSTRSDYGMGGAFMDGSKVSGLKSMVVAQFTGVSLQKDMSCWQRYNSGAWTSTTYEQYINADPDNIRMNPARLSRHISAINNAFIQEVSVFAIGHGIHHFTDAGGEVTITNSNSSFGGCAALSRGYKSYAFPNDKNWSVSKVKVAKTLSEVTGNVRYIYLGVTAENQTTSGTTLTLANPLAASSESATVPALLLNEGYTLKEGTCIWVENPSGDPWVSTLSASAWSSSQPTQINLAGALTVGRTPEGAVGNAGADSTPGGKRVYIRRLVDTRTPAERRYSLILGNTAVARLPQTNAVLQTDPTRGSGGGISRRLAATGNEVLTVVNGGTYEIEGVPLAGEVTIRRACPELNANYTSGVFYPAGSVVRAENKHWITPIDVKATGSTVDTTIWKETFVHMPSAYSAEDPLTQEARIITFDTDTDLKSTSATLGINWTTVWTSNADIKAQLYASTDYRGIHAFLMAMGYSQSLAHSLLLPRAEANRLLDPSSATDFPTAPTGGAASGRANWAVEFRRPSVVRLYGHAWEWAGFLNYSKSIPASQKDLSAQNKFSYYFTNEAGGRVVPQGSNEDGFNITPRGLENIETGATLTVESIGSSSVDESKQTSFDSLSVDDITVKRLRVTESVQLPPAGDVTAKTNKAGIVTLASSTVLTGTTSTTVDNAINGEVNPPTDAHVVTKAGLEYWKAANRLSSQRTEPIKIYVNPLATVAGGYENADTIDVNTLIGRPPTTLKRAVKTLRTAAAYAEVAASPSETVEFLLGPGVYIEKGTITFKSKTVIRAWDFNNNTALNDDRAGGTIPFSYENYNNHMQQPTFLTEPSPSIYNSPTRFALSIRPLKLVFEQEAFVTGVAWWGVIKTMTAQSDVVPDSFFNTRYIEDVSTWRASPPESILNIFIAAHAVRTNPQGQFAGVNPNSCMEFNDGATLCNIAIGAQAPADSSVSTQANNAGQALFHIKTSKLIRMRGISLIGNVKISSEDNTGLYSSVRLRIGNQSAGDYLGAKYYLTGHSFFVVSPEKASDSICTVFGQPNISGITPGVNNIPYNLPYNNVNLVNNNLRIDHPNDYPTQDPKDGDWTVIGPAIESWYELFGALLDPSEANWTTYSGDPTKRCGFAGKFGSYYTANDPDLLSKKLATGLPLQVNSGGTNSTFGVTLYGFGGSNPETIFVRAGDGAKPPATPPSEFPPGDIGDYTVFEPLNVNVRIVKKGVDVDSGNTARRTVVL